MSKRIERKDWNHLGVEIRGRTVDEANQRVANDRKQQYTDTDSDDNQNLHFLTCNFAASVKELLDKFPRESLRLISIQFPDPWKRKKHLRRLIVQKKLVKQLAMSLPAGAVVYISSDCDNVATWMVDRFLECEEDEEEKETTESDSNSQDIVDGKQNDKVLKKKCFRLLSSLPDLDSITTPNMFMQQSSAEVEGGVERGQKCPVQTNNVSSTSLSTVNVESKEEDDSDENEDILLASEDPPSLSVLESESAESYSWFDANNNPLGELSERELVCEVDWRGVRRCCFMRV
jgi:tRNA G46 methylase TrmB